MPESDFRPFRQHRTAPELTSALYRDLTTEWVAIHDLPSTTRTVRRWARTEPDLLGLDSPGEIIDTIDTSDHERKDALLLALVRLHQAGQRLAGRTVLQAMLPKLSTMTPDRHDPEGGRHQVICEFWIVLSGYPVDRRPRKVAANLSLDTLMRVRKTHRADEQTTSWDALADEDSHGRHGAIAGQAHHDQRSDSDFTANTRLEDVLAWAVDSKIITTDEAHLLTTCYLTPHSDEVYGFTTAALQLGLNPAAVRQRCSRLSRRLAAAVRTHYQVLATPEPAVGHAAA